DKEVAKALDITQLEIVYIICLALEVYNWDQYVQATNKGENSKPKNFFSNIVKHNISEDISKKLTLILTETFTIDYSNLEMQQQIQRFLEEYFENSKSSNKKTIESNKPSVSNRNGTTTLKGKGILQEKDKTKNLDHYEDITKPVMTNEIPKLTLLWDTHSPEQTYSTGKIQTTTHTVGPAKRNKRKSNTKNLSFYGRALVKRFLKNGKSNVALIEIKTKNLRRIEELIAAWAIYFEKRKMIRVTQREFDKKTLIEHSKNKMIVKNVSKTVAEATLLRQLKSINAKAVYNSSNRNGNQWNVATMYFSSDKERQDAEEYRTVLWKKLDEKMQKIFRNINFNPNKENLIHLNEVLDQTWENIETAIIAVKKTVKAKRQKIAIAKAAIALGKLIHEVKRNRISAKCLPVEVWNNQIRRINHLAETKVNKFPHSQIEQISKIQIRQEILRECIIQNIWQYQDIKLDERVWRSNVAVNTIEQCKNLDLIFDMVKGSWHLQENGPTIISMLDSKSEKQSKQSRIDLGLFFVRQLLDHKELLIDDAENRKVKEDFFSNDINTSALQPHLDIVRTKEQEEVVP
ncbi:4210_t:CDS:2, partial [Gigaspora margarita]